MGLILMASSPQACGMWVRTNDPTGYEVMQ